MWHPEPACTASITDARAPTPADMRHPSPRDVLKSTSDTATMKTHRSHRGGPMDYGWMSHALLWLVGILSIGATVGFAGALWSLGRSNYRKD